MDTLSHFYAFTDTLKIFNVLQENDSLLDWKTLIAVFLGGAIAIMGNFLVSLIQQRAELKKAFLQHHIEAYKEFSTLCWQGHSVAIKDTDLRATELYPIAYENYLNLQAWVNGMAMTLDRLYLFIDNDTKQAFEKLNALLISHLRQLRVNFNLETLDEQTRNVGRDNLQQIQTLTTVVLNSCRTFLRKTYKARLPNSK